MKRMIIAAAAALVLAACDRPEAFAPLETLRPEPRASFELVGTTSFTATWSETVLALLPGFHDSMLSAAGGGDINEDGWVVGTTDGQVSWGTLVQATLWTPAGGQSLGALWPNRNSWGHAINDHGAVAGMAQGPSNAGACCVFRAYVWTAGTGMQALPLLSWAPAAEARAFGINNHGHVVGQATDAGGVTRAVLWTDPAQPPVVIGSFAGYSTAHAVNDAGQIAGGSVQGAFRWSPGGAVELLGQLDGGEPSPTDINAHGHIVGLLWTADGGVHPFRWTPAGGLEDLGVPAGAVGAGAYGINDAGDITVTATFDDGTTSWTKAYLWVEGTFIALEEDGGSNTMTAVQGINEKLQLAGSAFAGTVGRRALRWDVTLTPLSPGFAFDGFFAPISNLPTVNRAKAGQSIPVKFSLGGDQGLAIFASGYPLSQPIACDGGAPTEPVESTGTAGQSTLTYDATSQQYTYVWQTERSWANSCRKLVVRLTDGTEHSAHFQFVR